MDARTLIDELKRARDILLKEINMVNNNNKRLAEEIRQYEKEVEEKKNEMQGLSNLLEAKRRLMDNLEKEKQKYEI